MRRGRRGGRSGALQRSLRTAMEGLSGEERKNRGSESTLYPVGPTQPLKSPLMYGALNSAQLELVQISKKFLEAVLKSPFHRLYRPDLSDSFLFPDQQTAATEFATSLIARNPSHFPAELQTTDPPAPRKRPRTEKANESLMRIKSQEERDEADSQDEGEGNSSAEESDSESISVGDSASERSDGEQLL